MNEIKEKVIASFAALHGEKPAFIAQAPGRVNIIGEHTDYNDGFVFPMAINRAVWIALTPREDDIVSITSLDYDEAIEFSLGEMKKGPSGTAEYIKGVAWALKEEGLELKGFDGVMKGDVPIGAGLSSSAAVEVAVTRAFEATSGFEWVASEMALLSQKAENQWVGVNCGIMDQMISAAGEEGSALLIDCRSLETESAPLPEGTAVVIMDTMTRRGLVDSAYNERRSQCEAVAAHFGVKVLRDVTGADFEARASELDDLAYRRAKHVITENDRTLAARDAMVVGDPVTLGKLMNKSHISLRDDFEVSNDALNTMVEAALTHPACYGARMTGAGFGGCAVALVKNGEVEAFTEAVSAVYKSETDLDPQIYISEAAGGASVEAC